jgi:hypothetical protein
MRIFLAIIGVAIVGVISIFWGGYVGSILWGWFVVPLGAPPISPLHAAGLACIVSLFMGKRGLNENENDGKDVSEVVLTGLGVAIVLPLVPLIMGWIIKSAM